MADPGTEPFEKLVALLNYPMYVVTTHANDVSAGCLVGFASQTSIHPPRFLVGLSRRNHTFRVSADATHLAVPVFDHEQPLAITFTNGNGSARLDGHAADRADPSRRTVPVFG